MSRRHAIDIAIDAKMKKHSSSLLSVGPLPEGVKDLLRIVAEGEWRGPTTEHVYQSHSVEEVCAASASFLAVSLFHRKADPYRILGITPQATAEEVRENKRLLLKWLHPDRNPSPGARSYLERVLEAAKAIEEGHAQPSAMATDLPPRIVVPPRAKKTRRAIVSPVRSAALQIGEAFLRTAKIAIVTAVALVICLLAWRYVMNEPIGVSLERYSKLALGMGKW